MTQKQTVQIGIIGFGKMGKLHAKGYTAIGCQIKWILDPHISESQCAYPIADDIEVLLRDCDIISICSPSSTHVDWAEKTFGAGIHTFIEKPLALRAKDCQKLIDLHQKSGLSFRAGVGHIERFNPAFQAVLKTLGRVGQIHRVEAVRTNPSSGRIGDADVVSDLMVHDLDLLRAVCGGNQLDNICILESEHTQNILDMVRLDATLNGVDVHIYTSRISTKSHRVLQIQGQTGTLVADLSNRTAQFIGMDAISDTIHVEPCDQIISQMQAWVSAVEQQVKPVVGLTAGLFAVQACDSVRQAVVQKNT